MIKHEDFSGFTERLFRFIEDAGAAHPGSGGTDQAFNALTLELFRLQFAGNELYRNFCLSRAAEPGRVGHWTEVPAVPAAGFKETRLTLLAPEEITRVFHSSGTTEQRRSRHFHSERSLAIYRASLLPWFVRHLIPELARPGMSAPGVWLFLTPTLEEAPVSSLVYMFETIGRAMPRAFFAGTTTPDGGWSVDFGVVNGLLNEAEQKAQPVALLGTAFSLVQLLDHMEAAGARRKLPPGSRVMETGGYKGRSRAIPRTELHGLIEARLGFGPAWIVSEYGMSELSSQAYDLRVGDGAALPDRKFVFPPWARATVISPENGQEVAEGELGILRICDLANVYSVLAVQTEDLAVRRGSGFELLGRAEAAETRGCSLMVEE